MSSCFGFRKSIRLEDEEALLAVYDDDTSLQRQLHQKVHSYQMYRALAKGYMPSTEQLVVNLRTFLAADILNPDNPDLSDSGRLLIKHTKEWLKQFVETLHNKNGEDQIQDFIWYLSKSRVSLDTEDLANSASKIKVKADSKAGNASTLPKYTLHANMHLFSLRKPPNRRQSSPNQFRFSTLSRGLGRHRPPSLCRYRLFPLWRRPRSR